MHISHLAMTLTPRSGKPDLKKHIHENPYRQRDFLYPLSDTKDPSREHNDRAYRVLFTCASLDDEFVLWDVLVVGRAVVEVEPNVGISGDVIDIDVFAMRVVGGDTETGNLDVERGLVRVCGGVFLEAFESC